MPRQDLCPYCEKPINEENQDFVDINQHKPGPPSGPRYAHSVCYEEDLRMKEAKNA